jgi:glycosyltransferase involved in cell wall biosynthesis
LDDLLREAVGSRMASDVPLGAFLSGGYDSTMVAAQMQAQSARSVKTFSIGFHDKRLNEAHHAKAVALELTDARMIRGSGVDLDEYPCLPEPEGKPVVVMVARLLRDKGAFEFVQAAQQLVERNVPVNMRLVGSPDLGNPTSVSKHDLESWKQAGVVELLGHVAFP